MIDSTAPTVRFVEGVYIIELGEEFASLYENKLDQLQLLPVLAKSVSPARVVVDMSHVQFIGSALIGKFVDVSKTLAARNGSFGLLNANEYCRTVINLTKLASFLPHYGSLEEAAAVRQNDEQTGHTLRCQ